MIPKPFLRGHFIPVKNGQTQSVLTLDRLTHKAHIIECTWESHRLQESLQNQYTG